MHEDGNRCQLACFACNEQEEEDKASFLLGLTVDLKLIPLVNERPNASRWLNRNSQHMCNPLEFNPDLVQKTSSY